MIEDPNRASSNFQRLGEGLFHGFGAPGTGAHEHIDGVFPEAVQLLEAFRFDPAAVNQQRFEPLFASPLRHVGVETFAGFYQRGQELDRAGFRECLDFFKNRRVALLLHGHLAFGAELRAGLGK